MKVSLITTVKNEAEGITLFLEGLSSQTRPPDEVVIVDGGSTDGTQQVVEGYRRRGLPVRLIVAEGANIARGRNIAIEQASFEIIAVTDAGCRPEENWLQALVAPLLSDRSISVVAGATLPESKNRFEACAAKLTVTAPMYMDRPDFLPTSRNIAFRKEAWALVGGYPEWLYCAEDTFFSGQMKKRGLKVAICREAVIYWRPRRTVKAFAKQFYFYGLGDGRVNLHGKRRWRQVVKYGVALPASVAGLAAFGPWALAAVLPLAAYYFSYTHAFMVESTGFRGARSYLLFQGLIQLRTFSELSGFAIGTAQRLLLKRYREPYRKSLPAGRVAL